MYVPSLATPLSSLLATPLSSPLANAPLLSPPPPLRPRLSPHVGLAPRVCAPSPSPLLRSYASVTTVLIDLEVWLYTRSDLGSSSPSIAIFALLVPRIAVILIVGEVHSRRTVAHAHALAHAPACCPSHRPSHHPSHHPSHRPSHRPSHHPSHRPSQAYIILVHAAMVLLLGALVGCHVA